MWNRFAVLSCMKQKALNSFSPKTKLDSLHPEIFLFQQILISTFSFLLFSWQASSIQKTVSCLGNVAIIWCDMQGWLAVFFKGTWLGFDYIIMDSLIEFLRKEVKCMILGFCLITWKHFPGEFTSKQTYLSLFFQGNWFSVLKAAKHFFFLAGFLLTNLWLWSH